MTEAGIVDLVQIIGFSVAGLMIIGLLIILLSKVGLRELKEFFWDDGLKPVFRFIFPSRVIPFDCDSCLQRNGEGWECDCEPMEFEPEARLVRTEEGSFKPDFTAVPHRRKVYCREFIPTRPYWRYLKFRRGRWIRPIGVSKS